MAEDSTITCTGTYNLTMTDYGVEPPSFMFGAMKTGDALTFEYNVVYKKAEESLVFIQEIN